MDIGTYLLHLVNNEGQTSQSIDLCIILLSDHDMGDRRLLCGLLEGGSGGE